MASLSQDPESKQWMIQFIHPVTSKRKTLRIGKMPRKLAESFQTKLEAFLFAKSSKRAPTQEVAEWVECLDDRFTESLVKWELLAPRVIASQIEVDNPQVMTHVDRYIESRKDTTPRTRLNYKQARDFLESFLVKELKQPSLTVKDFTKADAKGFRNWMAAQLNFKRNSEPHSENYVRTQCKNLKLFFGGAVDARLIAENPFKDKLIPCKVMPVPGRMVFVETADAVKILAHCPDTEWKLVFGLARWGGLRIPSEIVGLRWEHIDFAASRMIILQPKLKNKGKGQRITPLFYQLLPILREANSLRIEGEEYVLPRLRGESKNLRTTFKRIVTRAGVKPWKKPFQNLRSTRATELAEEVGLKATSEWLGHDIQISLAHYQQVQAKHWEQAVTGIAPNSAAKSAAEHRDMAPNDTETPC